MPNEKLPEWHEPGIEPTNNLKQNGFSPEDKPTAQHMNWLFHRTYKSLEESSGNLEQVTQQLAQKAHMMTDLQNQGVAFLTPEGNHVSWTHCNVSYDSSDDSFFVVYNAQTSHGFSNNRVFARKRYRDGNFGEAILIADKLSDGISCKCQSSGILRDGTYVAIVAHINRADWTQLGTFLYRSGDRGLTWYNDGQILVNGTPLMAYSGDVSGFKTLKNGRVILWGWYEDKRSFALFSNDNCATWQVAPIAGNPSNVTEPTFIELDDNTIIGYARDDVSDGTDHLNTPKAAWFLKSTDRGLSWHTPVKSQSIVDMSNNNCAFIKHGEVIEIIYGSRFLQKDGYGSVYQAVTTQADIKNDIWSTPVRIERVNGIPASLSGNGDSGYYGAATASDGTTLVFYYNGTKTASNIYYFKGNYNARVFSDKKTSLDVVSTESPGELALGDFDGVKGRLKSKRNVSGRNLFADLAVASNGELILSLFEVVNGTETNLGSIRINKDSGVIFDKTPTLYATNLLKTGDAKTADSNGRAIVERKNGTIERQIELKVADNGNALITLWDRSTASIINSLEISNNNILPQTDKATSLGSPSKRFANAYFTGVVGMCADVSSNRPTVGVIPGVTMFDRTLGKPIWWNGTNWVDAMGTVV